MLSTTRVMLAIAAVVILGAVAAGVMAMSGSHESDVGMTAMNHGTGDMADSTGAAMEGHSMGGDTAAHDAGLGGAGVPFDRAFIDGMVPHHEDAVVMAEVVRDRSSRPEIKELAAAIITAQEDEIARMKAWRQQWYGSAATPAEPPAGHGGMGGDLTTAEDVDRAFLEQMVEHHESAIDMADEALQRAEHQEIKDLATSIRETQRAEIDRMRQWHEEWYGS